MDGIECAGGPGGSRSHGGSRFDGPPPGAGSRPAHTQTGLSGEGVHMTTRSAFSDVHADPVRDGPPRDIRPRRRDVESPADPRTPDEGDPGEPLNPPPAHPGDIATPTIGDGAGQGGGDSLGAGGASIASGEVGS